jgi:hypothetical protein
MSSDQELLAVNVSSAFQCLNSTAAMMSWIKLLIRWHTLTAAGRPLKSMTLATLAYVQRHSSRFTQVNYIAVFVR